MESDTREELFKQVCIESGIPRDYIGSDIKDWKSEPKTAEIVVKVVGSLEELVEKKMALAFIGFYNSGKTFLSSYICVQALKKNLRVCFLSFSKILNKLEKGRYKEGSSFPFKEAFKAQVIVIDGIADDVWQAATPWSRMMFLEFMKRLNVDTGSNFIILDIDVPDLDTLPKVTSHIHKMYGDKFHRFVVDNFKPYLLKKYTGKTKKIQSDWKEVADA